MIREAPKSGEIFFPTRIEPLIPTRMDAVPANPLDWISEVKWNGIRAMVYIQEEGQISIRSRTHVDITASFPEFMAGFTSLGKEHSLILDGEIIFGEGKTAKDRQQVTSQLARKDPNQQTGFSYIGFDLLYINGADLTGRPIEIRKDMLDIMITKEIGGQFGIYHNLFEKIEHDAMAQAAQESGFEGVVFKRNGSLYRKPSRGPSPWLKLKF